MTATTMRRRRANRGPSSRYLNMAASPERIGSAGGERRAITGPDQLVDAVETIAQGREAVVWIHETTAAAWGLPDRLPVDHAERVAALLDVPCRTSRNGATGWLYVDHQPTIHLAFAGYLGDFAGLDTAGELLTAVEAFRHAVGFAYLTSGGSTLHTLIGATSSIPESVVEPELEGWAATAWATPSNWWGLDAGGLLLLEAAGATHVRAFDRVGSYLSAWQGVSLPMGEWRRLGAGMLDGGTETQRPAGYWLLPADALPDTAGLFDPWARHGGDRDGARWVTTPLAQLAVDLQGGPLPVLDAWVTSGKSRALDAAGARLRAARDALRAPTPIDRAPAQQAAYNALKGAYAAAIAWFEYGPRPPDPLARPAWRRTIIDRYAANTWRSLERTTPGPFAVGEIDTALYALHGVDELPDQLAIGDSLGQWKPKGRELPIADARRLLDAGGHRALLRGLEQP